MLRVKVNMIPCLFCWQFDGESDAGYVVIPAEKTSKTNSVQFSLRTRARKGNGVSHSGSKNQGWPLPWGQGVVNQRPGGSRSSKERLRINCWLELCHSVDLHYSLRHMARRGVGGEQSFAGHRLKSARRAVVWSVLWGGRGCEKQGGMIVSGQARLSVLLDQWRRAKNHKVSF